MGGGAVRRCEVAHGEAVGPERDWRRRMRGAERLRAPTARMEGATGRERTRGGRRAGDRLQLACFVIEARHRMEERPERESWLAFLLSWDRPIGAGTVGVGSGSRSRKQP